MRIQILILGFKGLTTYMVSTILAALSALFFLVAILNRCVYRIGIQSSLHVRDLVPREEKRDLGTSFPFATSARSPISVQNNLKKGEIEHQKAKKKKPFDFPHSK